MTPPPAEDMGQLALSPLLQYSNVPPNSLHSSAFMAYLNFCGLTFFSILSKNVDQEFVPNEETSFLGELWPHWGQLRVS
jgi:hypothetical protein